MEAPGLVGGHGGAMTGHPCLLDRTCRSAYHRSMDRDALFGSQHLPLVLSVLTAAPGREFGVRELMAHLHTGKDNVQRALSRAVASGVASRRVTAQGHRFTAATESPIYPELKLLLAKSHGLGKILADHFGDRIRLPPLFRWGA